MHNIFADQIAVATRPQWCAGHLGAGTDLTHVSVDTVIPVHSPFYELEHGEVYVSLEQEDGTDVTAIRLAGAPDTPMLPEQALQIGTALISAAFTAVSGQASR